MAKVHLRKVTRENFRECLKLQVAQSQKGLIATTTQSLAQSYYTCFLVDYSSSDRIVVEGAAYLKDEDSVVVDSLPSSPGQ